MKRNDCWKTEQTDKFLATNPRKIETILEDVLP
jgi:hypothetical protein